MLRSEVLFIKNFIKGNIFVIISQIFLSTSIIVLPFYTLKKKEKRVRMKILKVSGSEKYHIFSPAVKKRFSIHY